MLQNRNPSSHERSFADLRALSTDDLRAELTRSTQDRTGLTPRDFQLDAAVALCQGKDVAVIAGTGFGKTLIMVMPCFLSKRIKSAIASPLNWLEEDQVRNVIGISSD